MADQSTPPGSPAPATPPAAPRRKSRTAILIVGIVLVAGAAWGLYWWLHGRLYESTDDAFLEGHITQIAPRVAGRVLAVYVTDNQIVRQGDVLVELDGADFQARVDQAQAALDAAIAAEQAAKVSVELTTATAGAARDEASAGIASAEAATAGAEAQVQVSRSRLEQVRAQAHSADALTDQAQADAAAAQAQADLAAVDLRRYEDLRQRGAATPAEYDRAVAANKSGAALLEAARKRAVSVQAQAQEAATGVRVAQDSLVAVQAQLQGARSALVAAQARFAGANVTTQRVQQSQAQAQSATAQIEQLRAALEQAKLQLSYTKITAPDAGRITRKTVEAGDYLQVGQPLLALVQPEVWVVANFKETQLRHMRPGQPATVEIDAYPSRRYRAHVDSIQSGTGSRFSLLPPENATGNYVKVVQRVPVKIVLDEPLGAEVVAAPGMSVVPQVKVR